MEKDMPDMAEATITEYAVDDPDYTSLARTVLDTAALDVVAHGMELWMRSFLKDYASIKTDRDKRLLAMITEAFINQPEHIVRYAMEQVINEEHDYARKLAARDAKNNPKFIDEATSSVFVMVEGELCTMPIHTDGSFDTDELSSVDFHGISPDDAERCRRIERALKELI